MWLCHGTVLVSANGVNMFLKGYPLEAKTAPKNWNQSVRISWARLASFCQLGFISDPLIVSRFHNETHDPKGQENKIYTIVKGRETFYRRHTVPVTSCSEVKYVFKRVSIGSKDCTDQISFLISVRQHQKRWQLSRHPLLYNLTLTFLLVQHYSSDMC